MLETVRGTEKKIVRKSGIAPLNAITIMSDFW